MKADFEPKVGHKFQVNGKDGCVTYCQVLEAEPFIKLSYSWQYTSVNDHNLFDSKVMWTLLPKEKGTELHLVHNGFAAMEDYLKHNHGWTFLGNQLGELLNTIKNDNSNT